MKKIIDFIKVNKVGVFLIIVSIALHIINFVISTTNKTDSNNLIESSIQKQEDIHVKQEKEQSDKIDKKLSVITEIRKENKEIFTRIDKVEKKMDAVYLINQKKIDTKYDKKIKYVSNTRVDTTASILSGLLNDKLEQ